jgi:hypothetical protein
MSSGHSIAGIDPKRPIQFVCFPETRISACGMPLSHQLVITRAVRAGIVMINAAIKSGAATTRMDLRNATRHARMATTVTQNAIVANVNGYGSISMNRFGVHQSQYVIAASRTGSREHAMESSD